MNIYIYKKKHKEFCEKQCKIAEKSERLSTKHCDEHDCTDCIWDFLEKMINKVDKK